MDRLVPQFYAQQGIQPGSVHDLIIRHAGRSTDLCEAPAAIVQPMPPAGARATTRGATWAAIPARFHCTM
jgi:hypothetical protein